MEHEAQAARVRAEAQKLLNAAQEEAAQLKQQEERSRQQAQELAAKLEAEKQAREAEIRAQQDQVAFLTIASLGCCILWTDLACACMHPYR
eukprot:SAG31_NODE_1348_length_8693_cov_4.345008_3_plen_91_part_00